MTIDVFLIQAVGVVAMILTIGCYQLKKRKYILLAQYSGNALWCVHYFFLAAYPALIMNALNVVRGVIYSSDKRWARSNIWAAVFCVLPVSAQLILLRFGLVSFNEWYSFFPIIGTMIAAVALRIKDENTLRAVYITSVPFWIVYNAMAHSIPGTISALFTLVSIAVALIRYRKKGGYKAMKEIKLIVFDMDGTILNTIKDLADSTNYALKKCGYNTVNEDLVKKYTGKGVKYMVENCLPENTSLAEAEKVVSVFKPYYEAHCNDNTAPYDGIIEAITKLKEKGYKTAVLSNKLVSAVEELCKLHFDGLFDCIVGMTENLRPKPYPDGIEYVLNKLNVPKDNAVMIGDSEIDIETGRNAGVKVLGVGWGFRDRALLKKIGVTTVLSEPKDLLNVL